MPRFAANLTTMFGEHDFLDRFKAAAKASFLGVEMLFPYDVPAEAIAEKLEKHDLDMVLFNLPPGDWTAGERGLAALPGRSSEFRDSLGRALEYARTLSCPRLHCLAGIAPDGVSREAMLETYQDNLRFAARAAAEASVAILIEPINGYDMPGYFLRHFHEACDIIEAVDEPNLLLQCDIYHMQISGGDLTESISTDIDIIAHFQVAGVPDRHEPDVGEVNYPYLFDLIDSLGYDGWIGCEYRPRGATLAGLGWAAPYGILA